MAKETLPFSIYINHRPYRVAYLVDPAGDLTWIDRIYSYNREKWGGRYNPIILTNGSEIKEEWWKFLRDYDPDFIKSIVPLDADFRRKIQIFLSPLCVEINRPDEDRIHLLYDPFSILPTNQNISYINPGWFSEENQLVSFDLAETAPEAIRLFLNRNFGILKDDQGTPLYLKKALQGVKIKKYEIIDFNTLNLALLDLGEFYYRTIFPAQICSIPDSFKDVEYSDANEKFSIIVGDTAQELAYFWNRTILIAKWMRKGFTQLWLSSELSENETIRPGIAKLINRYVDQTGNTNSRGAHFVTFSLEEEKIKKIFEYFSDKISYPRSYIKFDQTQIPNFEQTKSPFFLTKGLELYRANSEEEHIVLTEPDVEEGVMGGQFWFVDLYIQFQPERFASIGGSKYWWQLPKRNNILSDLHFFNKPARINENGMFSVLMHRRSKFNPDENTLIIKLPEERSVFATLICGESYACIDQDQSQRFLSRPFSSIQRSDKGMYLSGVLSLFPDMFNASYLVEERYWRRMFDRLSNQNAGKDTKKKADIFNKIKKYIAKGHDFKESEEDLKWLAEQVFIFAKEVAKRDVDLIYDEFKEEAEKETEEYNQSNPENHIPFEELLLKNTISNLLDWNVLLLGVKPRCPRCGYRIWYHIDEAKQQIRCKGCGYGFTVDAEERWQYRLNSLVKSAFSKHGTVPVLLVLGQLLRDARSSYLYFPSIDLLQIDKSAENKEKLYGEIDLVCIKDGQFIIGEIKQWVGLFGANDFTKMGDIAEKIRPDVIIFSSMDIGPNALAQGNIEILRERLKHLEIEVKWYPISEWAFKPSPVR